jgi:hypothetical protein
MEGVIYSNMKNKINVTKILIVFIASICIIDGILLIKEPSKIAGVLIIVLSCIDFIEEIDKEMTKLREENQRLKNMK